MGRGMGSMGSAFYLTAEQPCPYLAHQRARYIATALEPEQTEQAAALVAAGFRRSQRLFYRPACARCQGCVGLRIRTQAFVPDRGLRRILKRNRDVQMVRSPGRFSARRFALFRRYVKARHGESTMAGMDEAEFAAMLEDSPCVLDEYIAPDGSVLAGLLLDILPDGYSALYSYFDPQEHARSLGRFMIADACLRARAQGVAYVYLGYWVEHSRKMNYKIHFPGRELLIRGRWVAAETAAGRRGADEGSC